MRTETTNQTHDAIDASLVDLQPRESVRAEDVKGGYDPYGGFLGRAVQPPSKRRWSYWG